MSPYETRKLASAKEVYLESQENSRCFRMRLGAKELFYIIDRLYRFIDGTFGAFLMQLGSPGSTRLDVKVIASDSR